jgi:multiple sugar transport system substrate-binding protein
MRIIKKKKFNILIIILLLIIIIGMYPVLSKSISASKTSNTIKIYSEEQGGTPRLLQATIDEFKRKYPNIKIEKKVFTDPRTYDEKLLSDTLSGGGPDVLYFDTQGVNARVLQKSDVLTDMSPLINKDTTFNKTDYNEKVINAGIYNGKLSLMPIDYCVNGYYSTEQIINENGINIKNNISENDFVNMISSKVPNQKTLFAYPINITDFIASSGMDFIDYRNKKLYFDNKEFRNIIDNYKKIYNLTPKPKDFTGHSGEEGMGALKNGTTLLASDEAILSYPLALLGSESEIKSTLGEDIILNTMPTYDGNNFPIAVIQECMGINSESKNKQAAYDFIKIALSETIQKNIVSIPVNKCTTKKIMQTYLAQFNNSNSINVSYGTSGSLTLIRPPKYVQNYYENITENIKKSEITDPTIEKLMMECLTPYFEGKQSYNEAIEVLKNKVYLYLNE